MALSSSLRSSVIFLSSSHSSFVFLNIVCVQDLKGNSKERKLFFKFFFLLQFHNEATFILISGLSLRRQRPGKEKSVYNKSLTSRLCLVELARAIERFLFFL